MMKRYLLYASALLLAVNAQAIGPVIGLNFGEAANSLAAGDTAGVLPRANWNNLLTANGSSSSIVNSGGAASGVSVTWSSPNTWASTGGGEENNQFAAGGNRTMLTGYFDTTDAAAGGATVTVTGLGPEYTANGYHVLVYALGGVPARGGAYTIGSETQFGTGGPANPSSFYEDLGIDHTDVGNYLHFDGLSGSSFTLLANAGPGLGFGAPGRAPINGIQIIPVPEPSTIALLALGGGAFLALARRRRS